MPPTSTFDTSGHAVLPAGKAFHLITAAGAVCITLAWLLPNHYLPWSWFYNDGLMAVALLLLAAAALAPSLRHGLPAVACVVAGVAAIPWLQYAAGLLHFSGDAWVASFYLLCLASAIATGFTWARADARRFAALLATAALAGGFASSVLSLLQCLQFGDAGIWLFEIAPGDRAVGNLAHPNNLATVIGLGVLGLWLLRLQQRVGRVAAACLLVVLLVGAALTQSRTALLFGPVVLLALLAARQRPAQWRAQSLLVLGVMLLQGFCAWAWPKLSEMLLLGPTVSAVTRGADSLRLQVWPILLDAVGQSPWFGWGWLQSGRAQLAVAARHAPVGELYLHSHNLFLDLVLWCGLPLGLALSALLLLWFVGRMRGAATTEARIGMMVVALVGTHAMLELPHHFLYFLIPIGLWVGLVEAERGTRVWRSPRWSAALACATAAIGVALAWHYPAVEQDFRLMRFETSGFGAPQPAQAAPDAPFLSALTESLYVARVPVAAGMGAAELARMRAVVERYPFSTSMYRYAVALALNGRADEARQMFITIRHIHGATRYERLRRTLRQSASDGPLAAFAASLPD